MGLPRVRPHPPLQVQHDPKQVQRHWSGRGTEEQVLKFPFADLQNPVRTFENAYECLQKALQTINFGFEGLQKPFQTLKPLLKVFKRHF